MHFKSLFFLFGLLFLISCSPKIISFTYVTGSMGGSSSTQMTADSIFEVKMDRHGSVKNAMEFSKGEWKALSKEGKSIDLNGVDTIQSPTHRRKVDAAPYAYLIFKTKDSTYQSASFDGGEPPVKLKNVVNTMLTFSMIRKGK